MTPLLSYLLVVDNYSGALGLFMLAGLTDFLDGMIAKNFRGQRSIIGSYLGTLPPLSFPLFTECVVDPLADKFLMTVVVTTLGFKGLIYGMHFFTTREREWVLEWERAREGEH